MAKDNKIVEKKKNQHRLSQINRILNDKTHFNVVESYKATRTNIMFSLNNEKGCKKVMITSATAGEGKTTFCINIAKTFAQTGAKVLIIDADLRAPRISKYLNIDTKKGLSNVLAGFDAFDDCVVKIDDNLHCICSGPIPPNPVELISSDNMKQLFEYLEDKYDYIFIDTPPVNIVTEGVLLSKYVTGVVLVTRQKYSLYKMVEKAIGALKFANAKIIGFILNDAKTGTVYSGYKSDGYRYGKKKNRYERYGYHNNETKEFDELNKNK